MTDSVRKLSALGDKCEFDSCDLNATDLVFNSETRSIMLCCSEHARAVVNIGYPEHAVYCENCGCLNPVN